MQHVFNTVGPVFGLIMLGYLTSHLKILNEGTGKGLADFVFTIAMPALLFRTMIIVTPPAGNTLALLGAFLGAAAITWFFASLMTVWPVRRPPADSASIAMGSTFGNTVMMGVPLIIGHFGDRAAAPMAVIIAIHTPIMWFVASLQVELQTKRTDISWIRNLFMLLRDLAVNPVLIGIVGGSLYRLTGVGLHPIPDKIILLLGQAGIPGALFALGMSLAHFRIRGQIPTLTLILLLKLIIMPAAAWLLATQIFQLSPLWTGVVVILSACPTGANAFLFANRFDRAVNSVSGSIAITTALSLITISVLLLILDGSP